MNIHYNKAQEALKKVAAKDMKSQKGHNSIKDYWESLDSSTKEMLINSVIGSLLGGGLLGASTYAATPVQARNTNKDKSLSSAVFGALLGALAGGGSTLAYNALTSGRQLPGEVSDEPPLYHNIADYTVGKVMKNPFLTLGGLGGGYMTYSGLGELAEKSDDIAKILSQAKKGKGLKTLIKLFGKTRGSALRAAALPIGAGLGFLADTYAFGDY